MECECHVKIPFGNMEQVEIVYCPLHRAAPQMYEALKLFEEWNSNRNPDGFRQTAEAIYKAKAAAEGSPTCIVPSASL